MPRRAKPSLVRHVEGQAAIGVLLLFGTDAMHASHEEAIKQTFISLQSQRLCDGHSGTDGLAWLPRRTCIV